MPFTNRLTVIFFFIIPSIIYAGLVTQFSFDFFAPDLLWKAYNSLSYAILDGRLDIPYESIGQESLYYNGKVYFYYGAMPTIIRFILAPFIDLNVTPVGRISVWFMTTTGVAALQYTLLFHTKPRSESVWTKVDKVKLVILSITLWFGGAHFVIIQKATLYHEPYAAMLLVASLFIAVVWRDIFWDFENRKYRLALYALFAALAVHTRQTVALPLYLVVMLLILAAAIDTLKVKKPLDAFRAPVSLIYQCIKTGYPALIVLGLGGGLLLFMNYLRFDDFLAMTKGEYGFYRASMAYTERDCSKYITGSGRFEIARIIPNMIYYLVGGAYTHSQWINELGLGFVRKEPPQNIRLLFLWSSIIFMTAASIWVLVTNLIKKVTFKEVLMFLTVCFFMLSVFILLAYTTITFRYVADFFLPFGFGVLYFGYLWLGNSEKSGSIIFKSDIALVAILSLSIIGNIGYATLIYPEYQKRTITNVNIETGLPTKEIIELLKNPRPRQGNIDEECARYDFKKK